MSILNKQVPLLDTGQSLRNSILATFNFEFSRIFKLQRMSVAIVMMLFPPMMIWILSVSGTLALPEFVIAVLNGMVCMLSLLLWATPNVYAELEGRSWTFVTTRPYGRWSILFGKYLIAWSWSFLVSWISLSMSILVVDPEAFISGLQPFHVWYVFSALLALASMVYAAIFSFFGVIIQRRAMVFAVGYFLVFELMLAAVPANVGKITMNYHLFSLLIKWMGWIVPEDPDFDAQNFGQFYGLFPWWVHVGAVLVMTALMLSASAVIIRSREYVTLEDSQI